MRDTTRRKLIKSLAAATSAGLAGCAEGSDLVAVPITNSTNGSADNTNEDTTMADTYAVENLRIERTEKKIIERKRATPVLINDPSGWMIDSARVENWSNTPAYFELTYADGTSTRIEPADSSYSVSLSDPKEVVSVDWRECDPVYVGKLTLAWDVGNPK